MWLLRLCKLLDTCLLQLSLSHTAQAIPLRMLETFTTVSSVQQYMKDEAVLFQYMERVFGFLIARNYFVRLRRLLDDKCPPLDGETLHAPSPLAEALLQLLLRPLEVAKRASAGGQMSSMSMAVCRNFTRDILATPHTDPLRYFVLPCFALNVDFPFDLLMRSLYDALESAGPAESDSTSSRRSFLFYGVETGHKTTRIDSIFSSFLLNSLMVLDRRQLGKSKEFPCDHKPSVICFSLLGTLHQSPLLVIYVRLIAEMMPNILQLPKSTLRGHANAPHRHRDGDDDSEESEDEDEELPAARTLDYDMEQTCRTSGELSVKERECLLESIAILNETERVDFIVQQLDPHIENTHLIYALCEICHNLMIYNKHAVFEYK